MIPLLFLNPRWVKENPVAFIAIALFSLVVGVALVQWLKRSIKR